MRCKRAARWPSVQQTFTDGITHQFLDGIAHWPRAELWVKTLPHEKRQNGFVEFERVTACLEELDFPREKLFGNLQLVFVAQAMEHELLIHAGEDFRAQSLLRPRENMAFERGVI